MEIRNSKSGVTGIPTGFNLGRDNRVNIVATKDFKWSSSLQVTAVFYSEGTPKGEYYQLTLSDGSKPICLLNRLATDEDRSIVARACEAVNPNDLEGNPKPEGSWYTGELQLCVAGSSTFSAYFCGLRTWQLPQPKPTPTAPAVCKWL